MRCIGAVKKGGVILRLRNNHAAKRIDVFKTQLMRYITCIEIREECDEVRKYG